MRKRAVIKRQSLIQRFEPNKPIQKWMQKFWNRMHIDLPLLVGILFLTGLGLIILYSASDQDLTKILQQILRLILAFTVMFVFAQIPPYKYKAWIPWIFGICLGMLFFVLMVGVVSKGAQRWLNLGLFRFQPSEIMKVLVPMMLAWYLKDKKLPPSFREILICVLLIAIPALVTAKQPDLGTAMIIAISGIFVLLLAGISWRLVFGTGTLIVASLPIIWHFMHDYQRLRIITFLNPAKDPLGSGYHIIQSQIALGSGGFLGKGYLNGTQSHLHFLPEHTTDFIFAVCGEELGLIGCALLLGILLFIVGRGLYITYGAHDTFTRLLAGSLILTFFFSCIVNMGMVAGIFPVVGMPLPLVSYGGTSMVTLMAAFGIIMSIKTHKSLLLS
jgi:rod shape determining protein RodA